MDIVYGFHPVRQLLRHRPHSVERLRIAAAPGQRRREIEALCMRHGIAFEAVSEAALRTVGGAAVHNGFVADVLPRASAIPTSAVCSSDPRISAGFGS